MDPGELHPEGWFGYWFDFEAVSRLKEGMSLSECVEALRGQPVARRSNPDRTCSWIWYYEAEQSLIATDIVFREERLLRVAETCHQSAVDYGAIPEPLHSWTWAKYWDAPEGSDTALLLKPSRHVRGGVGYDHDATRRLEIGKTTLFDAEQILRGRPAWILEFADGSSDAVWWQQTPTLGTTFRAQFGSDGLLVESVPDYIIINGLPGLREVNNQGSPRTKLTKQWQ